MSLCVINISQYWKISLWLPLKNTQNLLKNRKISFFYYKISDWKQRTDDQQRKEKRFPYIFTKNYLDVFMSFKLKEKTDPFGLSFNKTIISTWVGLSRNTHALIWMCYPSLTTIKHLKCSCVQIFSFAKEDTQKQCPLPPNAINKVSKIVV